MLTLSQLRFIVDKAKDQCDEAQQVCNKSGEVFRLAKDRARTASTALRKAEARLRGAERKFILCRRGAVAKLIYDSLRDPLPPGIRGRSPRGRQMLYQAGHYCIDFVLEHGPGTAEFTFVGQITSRDHEGSGIGDSPVLLLSEKSVIAETRSNQFGEFQMTCQRTNRLRLCALRPGEDDVIEVALADCFLPLRRATDWSYANRVARK